MLFIVEPFASAEIAYRRERITAEFARANSAQGSRRNRRASKGRGRVQSPAYRPAGARG